MKDEVNVLEQTEDDKHQAVLVDSVDRFMDVWDSVNTIFVKKIAEQIKAIEGLNATSINRLAVMADMNANIAMIRSKLQKALSYTEKHLDEVLLDSFKEVHGPQSYARLLTEDPRSRTAKNRFDQMLKTVSRQTIGTLTNLSNTTAISQRYMHLVDQAVTASVSGIASYSEVARDIILDLGSNGMQVEYQSGYHRRLDSAVRANLVSACNQVNQQGSDIIGEELGCDCKEISVHACPAPDHAPVQGHILRNEEWGRMQAGLDFEDYKGRPFKGFRRPIGEWNCGHFGMAFDSRYQEPKYDQEQLDSILEKNEQGFEWQGKHYSLYEGTQMMRKLETMIRKQMDTAVAAKSSGRDDIREKCQKRIDSLGKTYTSLSDASGIPKKYNRIRVEGFSRWKPKLKRLNYMQPLRDHIKENPNALKLEEGKQGKHIPAHNNYIPGRSSITLTIEDCQELIYNKSGTGTLIFNKNGGWEHKERIVADKVIGTVTGSDGKIIETNKATIHYSKNGAHIVPRKGKK